MAEPVLPTFFVIGAPKCGTSSLHHYLSAHPDVSMTSVKEPQLFAGPEYDNARLDEYNSLLSRAAPARGESSAVYSQFPRWPHVPERIRSAVPSARFIYLVGDPIERVVAHYAQRVLNGGEHRALDEATADFAREDSLYVCPSRYATQLRRYLRCFSEERLLVVDQDDLLTRREETMAGVFRFLGVDPGFESDAFGERVNTREDHRLRTGAGRRLEGTRLLEMGRSVGLPGIVRRPLRRLVSRQLERPQLSARRREQIAEVLEGEVRWVRAFTGKALRSWSL